MARLPRIDGVASRLVSMPGRRITRLAVARAAQTELASSETFSGKRAVKGLPEAGSPSSPSSSPSPPPAKKPKRASGPKRQVDSQPATEAEEGKSKPKNVVKRRMKPEPVYVIPEVEKKVTNFRGRLGYACLNTILRNRKPVGEAVYCARTCRIETIKQKGMDHVFDLGRQNVADLLTIIKWNEDNNIGFMRISSSLFPFASHAEYGYPLTRFLPLLAQVGALAGKYGHRLTTHPGQYVQLGSPNEKVLDASIRELKHHCEFLEAMHIGKDGVCIVHGGGVYGDKEATLERIKNTIRNVLPQNVRDRLVLENDEICYNALDLLPLCEELDVPLVFDHHHDALNPSPISPSEIIARTNAIFRRRGIRPKQHVSESRPRAETLMERRAHSDRVETLPDVGDEDIDLMIEAKDKEQAVLQLYRVYSLHPVIHANLRPPAENQTKETKGRKSNKTVRPKKPKAKEEQEGERGETEECEAEGHNQQGTEAVPVRGRKKRSIAQASGQAEDDMDGLRTKRKRAGRKAKAEGMHEVED